MADSDLNIKIEVDTSGIKQIEAALARTEEAIGKLNQKGETAKQSMGDMFTPATVGAGAFIYAMHGALEEFNKQDIAMKQVIGVLKATGNASGMTAKEIFKLADEMESLTNIQSEDIMGGINTLSMFKVLGHDLLPKATQAAADMSVIMGKDMKGASLMLGKALSDPIDGLTALKKAGISFDDSEKENIKTLMAKGKLHEAQVIILNKVAGATKDLAEQSKTPYDTMKRLVGDLNKAIGSELMPSINAVLNESLIPLSEWTINNKEMFSPIILGVTAFVGTLIALKTAITGFSAVSGIISGILSGPVGWIALIVAAGVAIGSFLSKIEDLGLKTRLVFNNILITIGEFIQGVNKTLGLKPVKDEILENAKIAREGIIAEMRKLQLERLKQVEDENTREADAKEAARKAEAEAQEKARKAAILKATEEERKAAAEKEKKLKEKYGDEYKLYKELIDKKEKLTQKDDLKSLKDFVKNHEKKDKYLSRFKEDEIDLASAAYDKQESIQKESNQRKFELDNNIGNARLELAGEIASNMSSLMQSNSEELFIIGKAAAMSNAIISVAAGITKALELGPWGIPLAASIGVAGAVQIATIASQEFKPMALGGVVTGPTNALVGEAGYPEAVIPLNKQGEDVMAGTIKNALKQMNGGLDNQPKNVYNTTSVMNIKLEDGTQFDAFKKKALKFQKQQEKRQQQKTKMRNY